MNTSSNGLSKLASIPSLDELADQPERARKLSGEVVAFLYYRAVTVLAALGPTFITPVPSSHQGRLEEDDDRLIGPEDVALMVGMSVSWVEKHVRVLPERVSVLGNPRWRKHDIKRWIKSRPTYGCPC